MNYFILRFLRNKIKNITEEAI